DPTIPLPRCSKPLKPDQRFARKATCLRFSGTRKRLCHNLHPAAWRRRHSQYSQTISKPHDQSEMTPPKDGNLKLKGLRTEDRTRYMLLCCSRIPASRLT